MRKRAQEIVELSGEAISALVLLSGALSPLMLILNLLLEVFRWL